MRIAVLADIHSNFEAFKTCVEEAEKRGITNYIFLGDYLGDMAFPQKTLSLLNRLKEQYDCTFIRGNKEEYWIHHRKCKDEIWKYGNTATGMLAYNYERLTDKDIDFFESMPIGMTMHYEGYPDFTVCHGSPFRVNQSMRPDYDYIDGLVDKLPTGLVLCGHFHIQTDYTRRGKRIINPGAIGVPLHSGGKTQFLLLNGNNGEWETEWISLSYNLNHTIKEMDAEKLFLHAPGWYQITKHLLLTGEVTHAAVVKAAMNICYTELGEVPLSSIPEQFWEQAVKKLCT